MPCHAFMLMLFTIGHVSNRDEVGKQEKGDEVGGEQLVQRKKVGGEKEKGDEGGGEQLVQKKKIGEKEKGDEVGGEQEEGNKEKVCLFFCLDLCLLFFLNYY